MGGETEKEGGTERMSQTETQFREGSGQDSGISQASGAH